MKLKSIAAGIALLSSGAASAGVTGNVGAFSEYVFRGVEQSGGAAVQGGLDWSHASGAYFGTWMSNTSFAATDRNGNGVADDGTVSFETDFYGGWTRKWGFVGVDVGLLHYFYRDDTAYNTLEAYAALLLGPGKVKLFYTPSYFGTLDSNGDEAEGYYLSADYPVALDKDSTITLTPQIGYSGGDGPKAFFGNDPVTGAPDGEYLDYSVTLAKTLESGFTFTLALIGTNLDTSLFPEDKEKLVIGIKKGFDL